MTPKEARQAIMVQFISQFPTSYPSVPYALDNQRFDDKDNTWVRLTIIFNTGSQDSLGGVGNRKYVKLGFINCQVFTKINSATNENDEIADTVLNIFDGVDFASNLWTYNGRVETVGSDGDFYQQNAIIDFEFEGIR